MPHGPTPRLGLVAPIGTELIKDGDDSLRTLVDRLDAVLAPFDYGLLSARPPSTAGSPGIQGRRYRATDVFTTFRDTGTSWEVESQAPPVVTALPSGTGIPFDGQEIYYLADPGTSNGATGGPAVLHLRYRAGATGSYKWEPVGRAPSLFAYIATEESTGVVGGGGSTDLATFGPALVTPLAGDYLIEHRFRGYNNTSGQTAIQTFSIGATPGNDLDEAETYALAAASGFVPSPSRRVVKTGIAAAQTIAAKYKVSGGTGFFARRELSITPLRVG